jgi:hypothetical protein
MSDINLIPADDLILHYNVEVSFLHSLGENGLIKIISVENKNYISTDQVNKLEKLIRLHEEFEINSDGIEIISNLLEKIICMQDEIQQLKNKLRIYEGE